MEQPGAARRFPTAPSCRPHRSGASQRGVGMNGRGSGSGGLAAPDRLSVGSVSGRRRFMACAALGFDGHGFLARLSQIRLSKSGGLSAWPVVHRRRWPILRTPGLSLQGENCMGLHFFRFPLDFNWLAPRNPRLWHGWPPAPICSPTGTPARAPARARAGTPARAPTRACTSAHPPPHGRTRTSARTHTHARTHGPARAHPHERAHGHPQARPRVRPYAHPHAHAREGISRWAEG